MLLCSRTLYIGLRVNDEQKRIKFDRAMANSRKINIIEPVVEGVLQLFFQSIIIYIAVGPGESGEWGEIKNYGIPCILWYKVDKYLNVYQQLRLVEEK